MDKIKHFFTTIKNLFFRFSPSTPTAIIFGSVIISLSIITSGMIIAHSNKGSSVSPSDTVVNNDIPENPLPSILENLGMDEKAFATCLSTSATAAMVSASLTDGGTAGVNGTPSTFVIRMENNTPYIVANISGAVDSQFFKEAIDQALNGTSTKNLAVFKGKPVEASEIENGVASNVYVIEYSDLECPFCTRLHDTMKQLRNDYAGRISFVYRNFPLVSIHEHAQKEAEMISCAYSLGGARTMYPFMDALFDFKIKNNIGYIPTEE